MRVFGIFAAVAAITSTVFARPVPAPAPVAAPDAVAAVQARDLTQDINDILCTLKYDVDQLIPKFEAALSDAESDPSSILPALGSLIGDLNTSITTAVTQSGLLAVKDFFSWKEKRSEVEIAARTASLQDIGTLIQGIEQDIADILCKIATFIQNDHPDIASMIQGLITVMGYLTTAIGEVCTDLSPYITPLANLLGPILGALGYYIPGLN